MTKEEQLKIYAAYLPYGLEGQLKYDIKEDFEDEDWTDDMSKFEKGAIWKLAGFADHDLNIPMGEGEFSGWLWRNGNTYAGIDESIKPILYDLSYLTKKELKKAVFDDHIDFLTHEREHWIKVYGFEKYISKLPYGHFQYLVEKHFNIFNLDESEYINKATLKY